MQLLKILRPVLWLKGVSVLTLFQASLSNCSWQIRFKKSQKTRLLVSNFFLNILKHHKDSQKSQNISRWEILNIWYLEKSRVVDNCNPETNFRNPNGTPKINLLNIKKLYLFCLLPWWNIMGQMSELRKRQRFLSNSKG